MHDPRRQIIGLTYRLHGRLRSVFSGPHADTGLVLLEAMVLATIDAENAPPTVSQIARELGYQRQSVQRAMNKLIELELVERQPNSNHKSAPVFVLTAAGVERLKLVHRPAQILADHLAKAFPDDRARDLVEQLQAMHDALAVFDAVPDEPKLDG